MIFVQKSYACVIKSCTNIRVGGHFNVNFASAPAEHYMYMVVWDASGIFMHNYMYINLFFNFSDFLFFIFITYTLFRILDCVKKIGVRMAYNKCAFSVRFCYMYVDNEQMTCSPHMYNAKNEWKIRTPFMHVKSQDNFDCFLIKVQLPRTIRYCKINHGNWCIF